MIADDIYNKIIVAGLNEIFTNSKYLELREQILKFNIDLIEENIEKLSLKNQIKILENYLSSNRELLFTDTWKAYIENSILRIKNLYENNDYSDLHLNSSFYVLLNRIKNYYENVDWFDVLINLSAIVSKTTEIVAGFRVVLRWLINADSNNLKKLLYRTETKKYPSKLKKELYGELILKGLLDQKIARRIRSDSSGELSVDMVSVLFSNRKLYDDNTFQDLIVNFFDTKHYWVARFIALNVPKDLIPYLFGLDDKVSMKILEQRMAI